MSLHEIDLAEKIADKVICVSGAHTVAFGNPDEVFDQQKIRELYGIDNGYFDPVFGSIELPRVEGDPKVFVICSGGSGIPVFRQLQRENIPFAAGILYEDSIDYQLAKYLAVDVVVEEAFCHISDETYNKALEIMKSCNRVINAGVKIGNVNSRIKDLIDEAKIQGKLH